MKFDSDHWSCTKNYYKINIRDKWSKHLRSSSDLTKMKTPHYLLWCEATKWQCLSEIYDQSGLSKKVYFIHFGVSIHKSLQIFQNIWPKAYKLVGHRKAPQNEVFILVNRTNHAGIYGVFCTALDYATSANFYSRSEIKSRRRCLCTSAPY